MRCAVPAGQRVLGVGPTCLLALFGPGWLCHPKCASHHSVAAPSCPCPCPQTHLGGRIVFKGAGTLPQDSCSGRAGRAPPRPAPRTCALGLCCRGSRGTTAGQGQPGRLFLCRGAVAPLALPALLGWIAAAVCSCGAHHLPPFPPCRRLEPPDNHPVHARAQRADRWGVHGGCRWRHLCRMAVRCRASAALPPAACTDAPQRTVLVFRHLSITNDSTLPPFPSPENDFILAAKLEQVSWGLAAAAVCCCCRPCCSCLPPQLLLLSPVLPDALAAAAATLPQQSCMVLPCCCTAQQSDHVRLLLYNTVSNPMQMKKEGLLTGFADA